MNDWYALDFSEIDTPALIIDQDVVGFNIQLALQYAGGPDHLRPHVKTHKLLEVAKMQQAAGIYKFKCATIAEAEMLGIAEVQDILIAYPVQGPKIKRVRALIEKFPLTRFSVLVDNAITLKEINHIFLEAANPLNIFIDVNNGQDRTGIKTELVLQLLAEISTYQSINLVGLHCYDGHIRMPSYEERKAECQKAFESVLQLKKQIEAQLGKSINLVMGGSPSFTTHARYHDVECSPGTFIFWDQRYHRDYREQKFKRAAIVATRVISKLNSNTYCVDLGHKSIASEFSFPRVKFLTEHEILQIGHSEEHLILKTKEENVLNVGQLLLAYPFHICPTVALHEKVYVVRAGNIVDQWQVIARKRKITI